jgi:hypothetical protein
MQAMILSLSFVTLLKLKKSWMALHQSSNFSLFPSNFPGSGIKVLKFSLVDIFASLLASSSSSSGVKRVVGLSSSSFSD